MNPFEKILNDFGILYNVNYSKKDDLISASFGNLKENVYFFNFKPIEATPFKDENGDLKIKEILGHFIICIKISGFSFKNWASMWLNKNENETTLADELLYSMNKSSYDKFRNSLGTHRFDYFINLFNIENQIGHRAPVDYNPFVTDERRR